MVRIKKSVLIYSETSSLFTELQGTEAKVKSTKKLKHSIVVVP